MIKNSPCESYRQTERGTWKVHICSVPTDSPEGSHMDHIFLTLFRLSLWELAWQEFEKCFCNRSDSKSSKQLHQSIFSKARKGSLVMRFHCWVCNNKIAFYIP